jgi:transposase
MAQYDQLTELLDLPHTRVVQYQLVGHHRVNLFVESTLEAAVCPTCQQVSTVIHDQGAPLFIRDLSIWNRRCWLRYVPRRFECATCQATFVERLGWREPNREYTQRYEQAIFERARREPTSQIAQAEQLSEDQVHGIFERWAKKR